MSKTKKRLSSLLIIILLAIGLLWWYQGSREKLSPVPPPSTPGFVQPSITPVASATPSAKPQAMASTPSGTAAGVPKEPKKPMKPVSPLAMATPPPIVLHEELIPKNIEIVRVYYGQPITGPGSIVEFDINGSGFNAEFEKMITVESGGPTIGIKELKLRTPNQIHGVLVIKSDTPTGAVFPQVLIQGKAVFRAPEPFAVIRPGEVLNLIFTEMGENGRSGRFRVFTNLTQDMYSIFSVNVDTNAMQVGDYAPNLPFLVDGTLSIGAAAGGGYGISINLGQKIIWNKEGIIQVVKPNVGQSGLTQQIRAVDGFLRPGDQAKFILYGSGFQPEDVNLLRVNVDPFQTIQSTMVYKSPGRMELTLVIPPDAPIGSYKLNILQGDKVLLGNDKAFQVVGINWTRDLKTDPVLKSGDKGLLKLAGRDLDKDFIDSIRIEVDSDDLQVGKFIWVSPQLATANLSTAAGIRPGDYLIKMTSNGKPVLPQFGSIIKIQPAQP